MKKSLHILACFSLILGVGACEQPESPDFQLNHELEAPLSVEKTYPFLGGEDALVDTTSEDLENLFTVDSDTTAVRIVQEEDFNFGDLDDAVPEVDADPTTVNAEIGEIELTNFASGSPVGTAGFNEITGNTGATPDAGDPVPSEPSSPPVVNIDLDTDYFESAIIKEDGELEIVMTNNLGFDVDRFDVTLNSGNTAVDDGTLPENTSENFSHDETRTLILEIPAETQLEDVNIDVQAHWSDNEMDEDAGNLIVDSVTGQDLIASEATAAVEPQSFDDTGTSNIDQNSFEFRKPEHFVELGSGDLDISINSSLDIDVEALDIVFIDIEDEAGQRLELSNIEVPASGSYSNSVDLTGYRIKAENGSLDYTISATTENTQQSSAMRTLNEHDALDTEVDLNNLEISRADGYIVPKHVMLNDDQTQDFQDNVDVFNDDEAEISNIDGISELSDRVSNLTFENPILSTLYNTNLGVNTTVYAVIAGTDNKGNIEYLTGLDGSEYQVESDEIPEQLVVNGRRATSEQVIKFPIEAVENPDPDEGEFGSNEFNASNTNSPDFFSNLPNKIRFVGVAEINTQEEEGEIVNPVIFDPQLGLDLPMSFSADSATFSDSLEADLGDLPKEEDDQTLTEAILTINYTNRLPIDLNLTLIMLDEEGNEVTRKEDVTITGAGVDNDGYVDENQVSENTLEVSFSEEELKTLYRTRDIELNAELNTPDLQTVRIRKDDSITLHIKMQAGITSTVN